MNKKLYHFTSHLALPRIEQEGICYGDIPLTRNANNFGEDTGVWLTTIKDPKLQGWKNQRPARGAFLDNTAIRLEVEIPEVAHGNLWSWSDYAERNVEDKEWQTILENAGGGATCAAHWFIFKGVVLPTWIVAKVELTKRTYSPSVVQQWEALKNGARGQRGRVRDE